MLKIGIAIVFCFVTLIHLLSIQFHKKSGIYYTKPLLMPLLIIFYIASVNHYQILLIIALFMSFLGDVFLMIPKKQTTILLGLSAFLIGHLLLIYLFLRDTHYLQDVPYYFYSVLFVYLYVSYKLLKKLLPSMKEMKLPGIIYMLIIFSMSFMACLRVFSVSFTTFLFPFLGSMLFILSDTLLAFNLFRQYKNLREVFVMLTYLTAELFITIGFIL